MSRRVISWTEQMDVNMFSFALQLYVNNKPSVCVSRKHRVDFTSSS